MKGLLVGEVARRVGVNPQTVYYYERRGLLLQPPRSESNYRYYATDAVPRVRFIKRAQDLGFTLEEIKELLSLRAKPRSRCAEIRDRAEAKVLAIDEKVRSLQAMRRALTELIQECSENAPATDCPILTAFDAEEGPL